MLITVVFLISCISVRLSLARHPLKLGLGLVGLLIINFFLLVYLHTNWMGLALVLVYVGGVLVIFCFIAALVPNLKTIEYYFWSYGIIGGVIWLSVNLRQSRISRVGVDQIIRSLSSEEMFPIVVVLLISLFLCIISVVKICSNVSGYLRRN